MANTTIRRETIYAPKGLSLHDSLHRNWYIANFGGSDVLRYKWDNVDDFAEFEDELRLISLIGCSGSVEVESERGEFYRFVLMGGWLMIYEGYILWSESH